MNPSNYDRGYFEKDGKVINAGRHVYWKEWKLYVRKMESEGFRELNPDNSDADQRLVDEFISKQSNQITMKTSKVKSVTANGTWESKFGLMYKFEYVFEDGQIINANHKTAEGAFAIGTVLEYEITNAEYNNGKVSKPQDVQQAGQTSTKPYVDNTKGMKIGHAITNATNMYIALGSSDLGIKEAIKDYAKLIYQISEELNNEL